MSLWALGTGLLGLAAFLGSVYQLMNHHWNRSED